MNQQGRQTNKKQPLLLFSTNRPMLVAIAIALLLFGWAACIVFIQKDKPFDEAVFRAVTPYESPALTDIVVFISFLGKHTFLIPANFLLLFYFLYRKKQEIAIRIAALALSSLSLKLLLKAVFNRSRPDNPLLGHVQGLSFPSGHALIGLTFYGFIALVVWQNIKNPYWRNLAVAFLVLLILLIAFSRVYLRVHYVSDVIAGLAIGFIWLTLSLWIIDKLETRRIRRK